jgi:hypothetical protein
MVLIINTSGMQCDKLLRFQEATEHTTSVKERIGIVVGDGHSMNAASAVTKIVAAETAGIKQVWMNQEYLYTLTIFAAAAEKTSVVRMGTAVI